MTESPSGQGAPEHDNEAVLLTEPSTPLTPSLPGQPTRDQIVVNPPRLSTSVRRQP